jgi:hypothetical protein
MRHAGHLLVLLACVLAFRPFPRTTAPAATPFLAAETLAAQSVFGALVFLAPQGLAVLEHLTGRELLATGRCRIDNLRALGGSGRILIGEVLTRTGTRLRHTWGESQAGGRIDVTCPSCQVAAVHARLAVADFRILETDLLQDDRPTQQNLRYIRAALAIQQLQQRAGTSPRS